MRDAPKPTEGSASGSSLRLAPAKEAGKNAGVIERFQELLAQICGVRDASRIIGRSVYLVL